MTAGPHATDLAKLMVRQPAATGLGLASATILTWNPETLAGKLDYQGTVLENIPVLSGTDALTWQPGDEVILDTWYPPDGHRRKGFGSFMIRGRVVRPGAANAQRIVQFLQSSLAKQIVDEIVEELLTSPAGQELAAFVITSRVLSDFDAGPFDTTGTSWVDLGGPTVADVDITDSGKALVIISADVSVNENEIGQVSVTLSGANTAAAPAGNGTLRVLRTGAGGVAVSASRIVTFTGLNPGLTTFDTRFSGGSGTQAFFFDVALAVLA